MKSGDYRLAIISDTHSLLRPEAAEVLLSCDEILHAGDIADKKTHDEISALKNTVFVRGNADKEWAEELPESIAFERCGFRFYMLHNKSKAEQPVKDCDFLISGHSHKYTDEIKEGIHYLNPGSTGPVRFGKPVTMMVLCLDEKAHTYQVERIDIRKAVSKEAAVEVKRDNAQIVAVVLKDMKKGRKVEDIATRNGIPKEMVNQILQIYTTHPGIDLDGILNRMDIWGK